MVDEILDDTEAVRVWWDRISQRILQEDAFSTGWQRIEATLLGTAIALAKVLVTVTRDRRSATAAAGS